MKNKLFFKILLAGFFLLVISAASFAQQTVAKGANGTYTVTSHGTNTYQWAIYTDEGMTTPATVTTHYVVAAGSLTSNTVTLTWPAAGTFYLKLTETNGDCSTDNTYTVTVLDVEATVIASSDHTCSNPDGNATFTLQLVNSGTTTANNTTALDGMTVNYKYSFGSGDTSVGPVTLNNGGTFTVAYTGVTGNSSRTLTVTLVSITGGGGGAVALHATAKADTTTLYDKPDTNAIVGS